MWGSNLPEAISSRLTQPNCGRVFLGRAGHDAALPARSQRHLRLALVVAEDNDVGMFSQKGDVLAESRGVGIWGHGGDCSHKNHGWDNRGLDNVFIRKRVRSKCLH